MSPHYTRHRDDIPSAGYYSEGHAIGVRRSGEFVVGHPAIRYTDKISREWSEQQIRQNIDAVKKRLDPFFPFFSSHSLTTLQSCKTNETNFYPIKILFGIFRIFFRVFYLRDFGFGFGLLAVDSSVDIFFWRWILFNENWTLP